MNDTTGTGRRRLLTLAALFIGPLAAAWLLYFGLGGWRPTGSTAHGELISPVVSLPELAATTLTPAPQRPLFRGVWTLTLLGGEQCSEHCEHALVNARQVRLALGKEMDRIGRALISAPDAPQLDALIEAHPGLVVVDAGDPGWRELAARFPDAADSGEWIYLTDPLGNLMMRFAWDTPPADIKADLKRLLKLSRIG
jgi:hypothetical protein